ncbi:MAG: hypothetical protein JWO32_2423 [Bacteroidetes bacterium]|nr:hypothetical protein [Bacteroidota bacterium]
MIALPELHNLIRSLNKPEKRFFKLLSATEHQRADNAIALFDFIENISDSDDLYSKTEKEKKIDVTLSNMEVLYNLILKSQRNFYSESITGFALSDELANLKILFEKAQYKQCRKMIKSVKDKALQNEKFSCLLELVELKKQLLGAELMSNNYFLEYSELKQEKENLIEREKNLGIYYRLYARLHYQIKSRELKGKETEEKFFLTFLNDPFIKDTTKALSRKAFFLLMKCRALCYKALKNKNLSAHLVELKAFMQKDELIYNEMPRQYIDVLCSLAYTYAQDGEDAKAGKILSEMQALLNSKKLLGSDLTIKIKSYAFNIELLLLMSAGRFKEAADLAQTIYEYIQINKNIFNKEDKSVLLYNLTNFYIYNSDYTSAASILEQTQANSDKNSRWDLKSYARIQEMIVHHELKEHARFALSCRLINQQTNKMYSTPGEVAFINFFNKVSVDPGNIPTQKQFKTLYNELKSYLKNEEDRSVAFHYFNFYAYIGAKAFQKPVKEFMLTENKTQPAI